MKELLEKLEWVRYYTPRFSDVISKVMDKLQILMPKKPTPHKVKVDKILIGNGYWGKGTTVYKCPNCGEYITKLYKHCGDCGQAIDWSDT